MHSTVKTVVFWLVIVVSAFLLWQSVKATPPGQQSPEISYSAFLSKVEGGDVTKVVISGNEAIGTDRNGGSFHVIVPASQGSMLGSLREKNVEIWYKDNTGSPQSWFLNLAPLLLLAALWFFMIRQMKQSRRKNAEDPMIRSVG